MRSDKQHTYNARLPEHPCLGLEEAFIFGYNVERLRCRANMNVTTFAQVAGISRPTVYKIERGESDLKLSCIKKVADALAVSILDLLTPPQELLQERLPRSTSSSSTASSDSVPANTASKKTHRKTAQRHALRQTQDNKNGAKHRF